MLNIFIGDHARPLYCVSYVNVNNKMALRDEGVYIKHFISDATRPLYCVSYVNVNHKIANKNTQL